MSATAIIRRKTGSLRDATRLAYEDVVDDRPQYLKEFPRASSSLKDLTLGVLLGRYVNTGFYFCMWSCSFDMQDLEGATSGLHKGGYRIRCC
jgi:hypothetical protein